jgi:hypothetical protein
LAQPGAADNRFPLAGPDAGRQAAIRAPPAGAEESSGARRPRIG